MNEPNIPAHVDMDLIKELDTYHLPPDIHVGGIVILDVGMRRLDHGRIVRAMAALEQLEHLSPEEKDALRDRIISVVPEPKDRYIRLEEEINIARIMEDVEDMKQCHIEPKPSKKIPRKQRYNSPDWNF